MPDTPFTLEVMNKMLILTVLRHLREKGEIALRKENGKQIWSLIQ